MFNVVGSGTAGREAPLDDAERVVRVEKLMSVSRAEFEASWRVFAPSDPPGTDGPVRLVVGGGTVHVAFAPRPNVRLGGLMVLPRALIVLEFIGVPANDRLDLIARFDRAFQRGGG